MAGSNSARSLIRPSRSRKKRIAQIWRCFRGFLTPTCRPTFQAGRPSGAGSYCAIPILVLLRSPLAFRGARAGRRWLCTRAASDPDRSGPPAQRPAGDLCRRRCGHHVGLHHHPSKRDHRHGQTGAILACLSHCHSRWRPTGGCRVGRTSIPRSARSKPRLAATFAITGSTAPIPSISANSCHRAGSTGLAWYGQTPRAAAMPNWTKPPSSMTVTRRSSLYAEIAERLPGLRVVGGCCGSDMRHIKALIAAGV